VLQVSHIILSDENQNKRQQKCDCRAGTDVMEAVGINFSDAQQYK